MFLDVVGKSARNATIAAGDHVNFICTELGQRSELWSLEV